MKKIKFLILSLFLISCNNSDHTNFIVIFLDDMGYGDLSSYGHPTIKTPNLDKMSNEGQKWTQFYSASSVCTPSRAGLLTGRLPIRNGMIGSDNNSYRVLFPDSEFGLPESEITIAEKLKEVGYSSVAIGKWHLGHRKQYLPLNNGFDYYFGIPYSNDMDALKSGIGCCVGQSYWAQYDQKELNSRNYNVPLLENNDIIERPADQTTITKRYSEKVVEYIKKNKNNKFFIYLAHSLPHIPLYASKNFLGSSEAGLYGDVIEEIDHGVGMILEELKKQNLDENTMIVFTSDNGPWLPFKTHGGSAGLLREGKGTTWEGGQRVPAIFWGAEINPGTISGLGSTLDILPTFLEISGAEKINDRILDGYSLKNTLIDGEPSPRDEMIFYRNREIYAIRKGEYKAHYITQGAYDYPEKTEIIILEKPLLYNLNNDPSEKFDISKQHPDILDEIELIGIRHKKSVKFKEDLLKYRKKK